MNDKQVRAWLIVIALQTVTVKRKTNEIILAFVQMAALLHTEAVQFINSYVFPPRTLYKVQLYRDKSSANFKTKTEHRF